MEPYTNGMMFPHFRPINFRDYRTNLPTAYDASLTTYQQMVNVIKFCNEIGVLNQDMANNWNVLLSWIETNGVDEAVAGLLNKWVLDGTMVEILNKTALKDVVSQLDDLKDKHDKDISSLTTDFNKNLNTLKNDLEGKITSGDNSLLQLIKDMNGGQPTDVVSSVDELHSKYPNGTKGVVIVTLADGTSDWYYYSSGEWKKGGSYQKTALSKYSVKWDNIEQPLTSCIVTLGSIVIDTDNKVIRFTKNVALDVHFSFVYPNQEVSVPIPESKDPVYIYYDRENKVYNAQPESNITSINNSLVCIGVLYLNHFFVSDSNSLGNIVFEKETYTPIRNHAEIVYGNLNIDYTNHVINQTTNQVIFSCNGVIKTSNKKLQLDIGETTDTRILHLYYDVVDEKLIGVSSSNDIGRHQWYVGALYNGVIYDNNSKHFTFVDRSRLEDREPETSVILFGSSYYINVEEHNEKGSVTFPAGTCFYVNVNGLYLRIPAEQTIAYDNPQSNVNSIGLLTFYYRIADKTVYADYHKHISEDIKLFSTYGGKIYGSDTKSYIVNGVTNGGWDTASESNTHDDLQTWRQMAENGNTVNVGWLGDSTWEGYKVSDPKNIFPVYINNLLAKEYANVISYNCSKGGYTTKNLLDNFSALTNATQNLKLLVIGGGLNDSASYTGMIESKNALNSIVKLCRAKGIIPVIATTQATALLYANKTAGGDWDKKQRDWFKLNNMRRKYAIDNNLDLLDFDKFTEEYINNSETKMSDMFDDYLHGHDSIHIFEAHVGMLYLSQYAKDIRKTTLVGVTTQNATANLSYNLGYFANPTKVDGFKVKYKYTSNGGESLIIYEFFVPSTESSYTLKGVNYGADISIKLDDETFTLKETATLTTLKEGYHKLTATSTKGDVDFAGFEITVE